MFSFDMYSLDPFIAWLAIACFWWWMFDVDDKEEVDEGDDDVYEDGDERFIDFPSTDFIFGCFECMGECMWESNMLINTFFAFGLSHWP